MKACGGVVEYLPYSLTPALDLGELQAAVALPSQELPAVPIEWEVGRGEKLTTWRDA
jgi:hypothetical protein